MRKYIFILLLILISCERDAKFNADESGRIYLYGILSDSEYNIIKVNVSRPVFGKESARPEDVKLTLEVDGTSVELTRDVEYKPSEDGEIAYKTEYNFTSGQKLELKAECNGLPKAEVSATVPELLPEVSVRHSIEESYRVKDGDILYGTYHTVSKFHVVLDEKFAKDSHFGVQVLRQKHIEIVGTPDDSETVNSSEAEEYDDLFENPVMTDLSSVKHEIVIDVDGGEFLVVEPDNDGGKPAFDVFVDNEPKYMTHAAWNGDDLIYARYEYYTYKVKVFRIPDTMYHSLKTEYIKQNSDAPLHLGFSPPTYVYSNVVGGLGMFAAVTSYETDWTDYN